jgi:hypothetical protein
MKPPDGHARLVGLAEAFAGLYRVLAERFAAEPEIRGLWQELARGAADDAVRLGGVPPAEGAGGTNDPGRAEVLRRHLVQIAERARSDRLSVEGAIALAFGLECSLAERHAAAIGSAKPPRPLLEELMAAGGARRRILREHAAARRVILRDHA